MVQPPGEQSRLSPHVGWIIRAGLGASGSWTGERARKREVSGWARGHGVEEENEFKKRRGGLSGIWRNWEHGNVGSLVSPWAG
jgi:hypothetical protein